MKQTKRFACLILLVAVVMTALVFPAAASNYKDADITDFYMPFHGYSGFITPRQKTDKTPLYLYIENVGYASVGVYVQAWGGGSAYMALGDRENLTYANGALVQAVVGVEGKKYSIKSLIYERGYDYATLCFHTGNPSGDYITGKWSPDSLSTYTSPDPVSY